MENHMPLTPPDKIPTTHNYCAYQHDLELYIDDDWDAMYRALDYAQEWYYMHGNRMRTGDDMKIVDAIRLITEKLPGTIQDWQTMAKGA